MKFTALLIVASAIGVQCATTTSTAATSAVTKATDKATTTAASQSGSKSTAVATTTSKAGVPRNAAVPGAGLAALLAVGAYVA
ncbi:hypothetical protein QQS21_005452 [Conoideocrella luteorostrata]|uniref:Uncharacterized protein n=1 Tax=Conoideocrella luteorostrata TaxID=1105319 RepID=A0AAJ0CS85_9HYPO|nr:hypothetical protein QQS21_005452 [Conoideocrella luteorostrata]